MDKWLFSKFTVKERDCILTNKNLQYIPSFRGLGWELYHSMLMHKNCIHQINADTGCIDSYKNILERSVRLSIELIHSSITKDNVVCQCCNSHFNSYLPLICCLFIGIPIALIDPSLPQDDIVHILKLLQPKIIFISLDIYILIDEFLEQADFNSEIVVLSDSDNFEEPTLNKKDLVPLHIKNPDETAIILCTTGTSKNPKLLCLSHAALLSQTVNFAENLGVDLQLTSEKLKLGANKFRNILSAISPCWISGLRMFIFAILTGASLVTSSNYETNTIWKCLENYQVEILNCSTFDAALMTKTDRPETFKSKSLKLLLTTGRAMSKEEHYKLRRLLPLCFITNIYEHTEGTGVVAMYNFTKVADIRDQYEKPSSCGRIVKGVCCKIVDPKTDQIVGVNQYGELRYVTDFFMNGYHKMRDFLSYIDEYISTSVESRNYEPTKDFFNLFDNDGWIKTGDIAFYDEKRRLCVLGRLEDIFTTRSGDIIPSVIETVIRRHPAVKDSVVVATSLEKNSKYKLPKAFVSLNKGWRYKVTNKDLEMWSNAHLPKNLALKGGFIVRERDFIRGKTGQVRKTKMDI